MSRPLRKVPPVVIGGLGGSGTRAVAQIFIELGFHMGSELNHASDNLWFTLLLKRPFWDFHNPSVHNRMARRGLEIFFRAMTGGGLFPPLQALFLRRMARHVSQVGTNYGGADRGPWAFDRAKAIRSVQPADVARFTRWGWKEPNAHIYLPQIMERFPKMRYIHVIRHGLDLSCSKNRQQLHHWGSLFGIQPESDPELMRRASLAYWVRANRRALDLGRALGSRFMPLLFDELCDTPRPVVKRMLDFLEIEPPAEVMEAVFQLPKVQKTKNRYLAQDPSAFDPEDVDYVRELGFEVKF